MITPAPKLPPHAQPRLPGCEAAVHRIRSARCLKVAWLIAPKAYYTVALSEIAMSEQLPLHIDIAVI